MKRSATASITAVIFLYLAIMYLPFQKYAYWGMDEGEYIAMTEAILRRGLVLPDYHGWTQGYPYYQGYFVFTATFSGLSGISVNVSMWALVFASFTSIIGMFLLVKRMAGVRSAILSSAFLAVIMPFVYQNSHPAPVSTGHILFIFSLLSFYVVEKRSRPMLLLPVFISASLIPTHPMSGYMLLIVLGTIYIFRLISGREREKLGLFLGIYAVMLLIYSATQAYPFFGPATGIPGYLLIIFALITFPAIHLLERITPSRKGKHGVSIPDVRSQLMPMAILSIVSAGILSYMLFVSVPGTNERINPESILFYMPMIILSILAVSGARFMRISEKSRDIIPWMAAIAISASIGWITDSDTLIPFRHMEYLLMPMAVMFGVGMSMILLRLRPDFSKIAAMAVLLLLIGSALLVYPPPEAMQNFTEGTEWSEVPSVMAASELDGRIATDHRLSSVLMSMGHGNVSWDDAREFFESPQESAYPADNVLITERMSHYAVFSWKDSTLEIDSTPFMHSDYLLYADDEGQVFLFTKSA